MPLETQRHGSVDRATVEAFGEEWRRFDQSGADPDELLRLFDGYFALFPWDALPPDAVGFDLGCGSGRWARLAAPRVRVLVCLDASREAIAVAQQNAPQCPMVVAVAGALPVRPASVDFAYSLGVLHHIPEPLRGLRDAVEALKPGAPFLVYLYYAFDNRPGWFSLVWRGSDLVRKFLSRQPTWVRHGVSELLAVAVYLPLARFAALVERTGRDVKGLPLAEYRHRTLYGMRTDALDRFGTRLEHRFTRDEVFHLLEEAGLERVVVSDEAPFWCALGYKPTAGVP